MAIRSVPIPQLEILDSVNEVYIPCTRDSVDLGIPATTKAATLEILNKQSYRAEPVSTPSDLRNVEQLWVRDGQMVPVLSTREDFIFQADSAEADNGATVFQPTWATGNGRFVLFSGGGQKIQENGVELPQQKYLNFLGDGLVTDDPASDRTNVQLFNPGSIATFQGEVLVDPTTGNVVTVPV